MSFYKETSLHRMKSIYYFIVTYGPGSFLKRMFNALIFSRSKGDPVEKKDITKINLNIEWLMPVLLVLLILDYLSNLFCIQISDEIIHKITFF